MNDRTPDLREIEERQQAEWNRGLIEQMGSDVKANPKKWTWFKAPKRPDRVN